MPNVFDKNGQPINLGPVLGRGGEGSVYEIANRPDLVVKLYHKALDIDKAAKVTAMVALQSERILKIAAWPISTIHEKPGAPICGLVMPKISGYKQVHMLYGPKSRLSHFPNATWPFLIHTAMNVARSFAVMHEHGHVIGDVNESNLFVSDQAMVRLIDCDSFQIVNNGHSYLCEVGVPTHTSPELQGKPFHGVNRTANHDNFGLAVVIFQLLFLGRHPFSGQYLGPGQMPIEKAISTFRFAYGSKAAASQMKPPPATLPLAAIPYTVSKLFEQAFSADGAKANGRPRAEEWVSVLTLMGQKLKACNHHSGHQYFSSLSACPFCTVESHLGRTLFNTAIATASGTSLGFDVESIWVKICAIPHPGPLPDLPLFPSFSSLPPLSFAPLPPLKSPKERVNLLDNLPLYLSFQPFAPLLEPEERLSYSVTALELRRKYSNRRLVITGLVTATGIFSLYMDNIFVSVYLMVTAFALAYTLLMLTFKRNIAIQYEIALKVAQEEYDADVALRRAEEIYRADAAQEDAEKRRKLQMEYEAALKVAQNQYNIDLAIRDAEELRRSGAIKIYNEKRRKADSVLKDAEDLYHSLHQQWNYNAGSQVFDKKLSDLEMSKKQWQQTMSKLQQRLQKLEKEGAIRQLERYLDRFKLQNASIDGIGPGRKATLQSYGIETAADVTKYGISNIPGFGDALTNTLLTWRRMHESRFVYNPSIGIDAADKAVAEREIAVVRLKLENELRDGPQALQKISQQISDNRKMLRPKIEMVIQAGIAARKKCEEITL